MLVFSELLVNVLQVFLWKRRHRYIIKYIQCVVKIALLIDLQNWILKFVSFSLTFISWQAKIPVTFYWCTINNKAALIGVILHWHMQLSHVQSPLYSNRGKDSYWNFLLLSELLSSTHWSWSMWDWLARQVHQLHSLDRLGTG